MPQGRKLLTLLLRFERRVIVRAMRKHKTKTEVARALGISRPTLYDRIAFHNITHEETQT